jgi:mRNA interferase MazF
VEIKQGDLYKHDFGPRSNHLQEGPRPVVVIQTNALSSLEGYPNVMVAPVTTKQKPSATYAAIEPTASNLLTHPSWVITNQIFTLDKRDLTESLGSVQKQELHAIKQAVKISLALD